LVTDLIILSIGLCRATPHRVARPRNYCSLASAIFGLRIIVHCFDSFTITFVQPRFNFPKLRPSRTHPSPLLSAILYSYS
ncbi:hypothetical protein C8R43DRAFT_1015563, partial [Mycena crocata]